MMPGDEPKVPPSDRETAVLLRDALNKIKWYLVYIEMDEFRNLAEDIAYEALRKSNHLGK